MTIATNILAMNAAKMKRDGASLSEIAKFWNEDKPLTRQRIGQLVKRGRGLLAVSEKDTVRLADINKDQPLTESIALRLGVSPRVSSLIGKMGFTPKELEYMLTSLRHKLIAFPGMGIKSFNEIADLFDKVRWKTRFFGKAKYGHAGS